MSDKSEQRVKEEIGLRLKVVRRTKGVTAYDLGEKIGYSQSHISGIENGKKTMPTPQFIEKYLKNLCSSSREYNMHVENINKIAEGYLKLDKVNDFSKKEFADTLNNLALRYEFTFKDYDGKENTHIYQEPINDLHFQLQNYSNPKYYRKYILSNEDRENIDKLIKNYLDMKKTTLSQTRDDLLYKNLSKEDLIEDYEKEVKKIEDTLKDNKNNESE